MNDQPPTAPGRRAYVAGVGMTPFARDHDAPFQELGAKAIHMALDDAQISWRDVELVIAGVVGGTWVRPRRSCTR